MAGPSEVAFVIPIVLFTLALISGTIFIVTWLTKNSKESSKNTNKSQTKERHPTTGKIKPTASKSAKKKPVPLPKGNPTAQHKFDHSHLLATLKGHTAQITGGDFSSNGKHFITSAQVVRGCPYLPHGVPSKGRFKAASHSEEDSGCWLSNSPCSSSNTPSDTEDSLTSSSSSGSKMTRRQRRNKKRKKNMAGESKDVPEPSRTSDDEPPLKMGSRSPLDFKFGKTEKDLHHLLLPLCLNVQERILSGYPYQTYRGVYVYKALGFSKLESVLGNHRLVDAEIEGFSAKQSFCSTEDSMNNHPGYIFTENICYDNLMGTIQSFPPNYQKCSRCRQFFNVWANGEKNTCFYHPKKAVLVAAGAMQFTCCQMSKMDTMCPTGCMVSNYHVYHHLSSGINGPLPGFLSTQPTQRPPCVYGLDCEMVFTSSGFEVARATMVNVEGATVLDLFIQPAGEVFDFNTEFSGIMPEHLLSAVTFEEAQRLILNIVKSADILVGHSLEGDLVVLKILHRRAIDTSLLFKVASNEDGRGGSPLPRRQGLKTLVKEHLGQDIQNGGLGGHSSVEDATAALFLVLNQVNEEVTRKGTKRSKIAPLPPMLRAITA